MVYWALRRDQLCDPGLCPDAPEGGRCDNCPQNKLDVAQSSEVGLLLRRALDLKNALRLGIYITLDDVLADEFYALMVIEEEQDRLARENNNSHGG